MSGCGVWVDDAACARPEADRLWFLNEWMDHHGHGQARVQGTGRNPTDVDDEPGPALGLAVCRDHLAGYLAEQLV